MVEKSRMLSSLAFKFGVLGSVGLIISIVLSVLVFQDVEGLGFDFFNHTLSELGDYSHSKFAVVINGGLFFGSLSLIMFCLFSIQFMDNKAFYPLLISLICTFISLAAAGLFPINVYHLHTAAFKYFFYCGGMSSFLYLLYILMRGRLFYTRWNALTGTLTFISFLSFLLFSHQSLGLTTVGRPFYQEMVMSLPRPDIWWPTVLGWICIGLFMLWILGLVTSLRLRA